MGDVEVEAALTAPPLTAAELEAKLSALREQLAARDSIDDEGARLQRAVQRQEEIDSLKTIDLLRQMDAAFQEEVKAGKAAAS